MKTLATITLNVPQCSQGLHLRWYANGWHYLTLQVGDESYLTAGLFSNTEANAKQRIAVEDVPAANLDAIIALARVGSFDVLTPKGWRNGTFDGGDITTFETDANYYRAEFMLNVYGKTYPYSPVTIAPPEPVLNDLDILRAIRDANPASQLPALWSEDKDPYTQWEGVTWLYEKVTELTLVNRTNGSFEVSALNGLSKLTSLQRLVCSANNLVTLDAHGMAALQYLECDNNQLVVLDVYGSMALEHLYCYANKLSTLDPSGLISLVDLNCNGNLIASINLTGLIALRYLSCSFNKLTEVSSLTSKGLIDNANFYHNLLPPDEVARLKALGFTDHNLLPQDI